jgi:RNA polymerase sigma-70 factor, ECF subfamily
MKPTAETLQQLIAATARGDHACFARIYERTHVHLFSIAQRMLGSAHAAEDVLQEAYVNIWKNAATYQADISAHEGHAMAWLIAVLRNKALDALRSRTRLKEAALPEDDALADDADAAQDTHKSGVYASALELLTQATEAAHIGGCMAALDGTYRQSLALAYYQGLSHSEVAAQMGVPLGSVKAWIRRGLDKLKDCLAARGALA